LVASAVNGLKPERVSVVDETGRLLADGARSDNMMGLTADERQIAFERRLRDQVETIVTSVVGPGRARAQLTADFDFNRVTQTSERYDPEGRVLRSSQTREESSATAAGQDGQVTVGNELPGGQRPPGGDGAAPNPREQSRKTEEVVNYEISRSTKTEVTEGGRVNRISVAVLVDGNYTRNPNGEAAYQPRPQDELDRITALVRTTIGFDERRGDQVEVVNLRFAETPAQPLPEPAGWMSFLQFTKADLMHWIEILVMALLGLVVLFTVIRPLVRRILTPDGAIIRDRSHTAVGGDVQDAIAGPSVEEIKAAPNQTAKMIDIAQVQGQVHAQSVQRVGELVDGNPSDTVSIIRTWLLESAA
jgi:flagellar M-ring protein FliF